MFGGFDFSLCVVLQWTHPVKGILVLKRGISHSDAKNSGKYYVSTGFYGFGEDAFSGLDEFSIIQPPFSLYTTYSEAELRVGCRFHWEFYVAVPKIAPDEWCDCLFAHAGLFTVHRNQERVNPWNTSIFSVCIELHIKQVLQQSHRELTLIL